MPMWFILTNLKGEEWRTQLELARALRIEGPTLTRHLDGLEEDGLVVRRRDASVRRAVSVELTDPGRAKHAELLRAVQAFNRRLLAGFSAEEIDELRKLLGKLQQNARSGDRLEHGSSGNFAATTGFPSRRYATSTESFCRYVPATPSQRDSQRQKPSLPSVFSSDRRRSVRPSMR